MWKYHIPSDTWQQMGNLPFGASDRAASFVLSGKGYFLTGRDSVNNANCDTMLWEYEPTADMWTRKASFPDEPRQQSSYFSFDNVGYVAQTYGCNTTDSHLWSYDPVQNKWSQLASLPNSILTGGSTAVCKDSTSYLFGGHDVGFNFCKDVWKYNILSNQWVSMGQMPGLNRDYSIFWSFDSIIIGGGGRLADNNLVFKLGSDFYKYDLYRNIWTSIVFQNSFDSTAGGATFKFHNKAFYFGGLSSLTPSPTSNNQMWSFDASKYIHDRGVGIQEINEDYVFKVYPNPMRGETFNIQCPEAGVITFYDVLGQTIYKTNLISGVNTFNCGQLAFYNSIIIYNVKMNSGKVETGKVVTLK